MNNFLAKTIECYNPNATASIYDLIVNWNEIPIGMKIIDEFLHLEASNISSCGNFEKCYSLQVGETTWMGTQAVIMIINDITPIKNRFNEMLGQKYRLLATASHELRTPLNGVLGTLDLVMEELEPCPSKEKLEVVLISGKLLLNMINDLLDLSLITNGKLQLNFELISLNSLIEETAKILRLQAAMKGI